MSHDITRQDIALERERLCRWEEAAYARAKDVGSGVDPTGPGRPLFDKALCDISVKLDSSVASSVRHTANGHCHHCSSTVVRCKHGMKIQLEVSVAIHHEYVPRTDVVQCKAYGSTGSKRLRFNRIGNVESSIAIAKMSVQDLVAIARGKHHLGESTVDQPIKNEG